MSEEKKPPKKRVPKKASAEPAPAPEAAALPTVSIQAEAPAIAAPKEHKKIKNSAVGRRKTAVAIAKLMPGSGKIIVNKKPFDEYFKKRNLLLRQVMLPLEVLNADKQYDAHIKVSGGGISSQAGAVSLGIARAFLGVDPSFKSVLRKAGLLTRDDRMKERKKYGRKKARKRFQFSKR